MTNSVRPQASRRRESDQQRWRASIAPWYWFFVANPQAQAARALRTHWVPSSDGMTNREASSTNFRHPDGYRDPERGRTAASTQQVFGTRKNSSPIPLCNRVDEAALLCFAYRFHT